MSLEGDLNKAADGVDLGSGVVQATGDAGVVNAKTASKISGIGSVISAILRGVSKLVSKH